MYLSRCVSGISVACCILNIYMKELQGDMCGHVKGTFFFFFVFLGLHMMCIEVPMLGVELEL